MKKTRLLIAACSSIILWSSSSYALTQDLNNDLSQGEIGSITQEIFGVDLDSYLGTAREFLIDTITETLNLGELEESPLFSGLNNTILQEIQSRIGDLFGVFGYPNPNAIDREIPEIIVNDETEEIEEFTTFGKKQLAISSGKRQIMSAYIESRMGEEAQQQKKQQLEAISLLADSSLNAATDAASSDVTQDVMKQIAVQQANNAFISQAIHAELAQLGLGQNMSLSELSNISENMEQQEWQGKVNSAAARVSFVDAITQFSSLF